MTRRKEHVGKVMVMGNKFGKANHLLLIKMELEDSIARRETWQHKLNIIDEYYDLFLVIMFQQYAAWV